MTEEPENTTFQQLVEWIEEQLRDFSTRQTEAVGQIQQLHRQLLALAEEATESDRKIRDVEPRLQPLRGVPDKLRGIEEDAEQIRQRVEAYHSESESAIKRLQAEVEYERQELGELFRKLNQTADQVGLVAADVSQTQTQVSQVSQSMQTLIERQREVEATVEQFGLRLDRHVEVNRDMEARLREEWRAYEDDRVRVVYERLQMVGEMVKRNEELIEGAVEEQTLRETVLQEIGVWRDQHTRLDQRISTIEESAGDVVSAIDKLQGHIALVEGRHSGLGERVAGMRREIAEVVDHVRDEFAKYNQMIEKQRRKQIQVLEQELREMKFHAFRPPEEP